MIATPPPPPSGLILTQKLFDEWPTLFCFVFLRFVSIQTKFRGLVWHIYITTLFYVFPLVMLRKMTNIDPRTTPVYQTSSLYYLIFKQLKLSRSLLEFELDIKSTKRYSLFENSLNVSPLS